MILIQSCFYPNIPFICFTFLQPKNTMIKGIKFYDIPNFTAYKIDEFCKILSLYNEFYGFEIKQRIDRSGYLTVRLCNNSLTQTLYVHRIIAKIFIDNNQNKQFINHKNGNKLDNRVENLEWVTHSENIQHAYDNNLISSYNKCNKVLDKKTGLFYPSIKVASEKFKIPYSTLKNMLNGNRLNKTSLVVV